MRQNDSFELSGPRIAPLDSPLLPPDIHVWRIALTADDQTVDELAACLDQAELARAARFHFARDRRRFIVSHAATRHILAQYLGVQAADVRFTRAAGGKPHLTSPFDSSRLHFNLSHAHEVALLAVAQARPVGVDVEYVRPMPDALSLAETFFAPAETAQLRPFLDTPQRDRLFYTCWTRKEAFIKATGDGLARPLDSFVVTFLPTQPPALRQADPSQRPIEGWTLIPLEPGLDYVASLVMGEE